MPIRPASSTCIALMKPCPSSPSRWSSGTRQSWKTTSLVSLARRPSLFSFLPADMPGVPRGTMNAEMPRLPFVRSVTAIATITPATLPCVMKVLAPLSTQWSPSRTAMVRVPAASLPAVGSVSPQAPEHLALRQRRQEPLPLGLGAEHEDLRGAEPVVRGDEQRHRRVDPGDLLDADAVLHRGHGRAAVLLGELDAQQPEVGEPRDDLVRESCCASSHSMTCGPSSVSANSRTVRRSTCCSSVGRKSMAVQRRRLAPTRPGWTASACTTAPITLDLRVTLLSRILNAVHCKRSSGSSSSINHGHQGTPRTRARNGAPRHSRRRPRPVHGRGLPARLDAQDRRAHRVQPRRPLLLLPQQGRHLLRACGGRLRTAVRPGPEDPARARRRSTPCAACCAPSTTSPWKRPSTSR